jgi:glycosyltransferase involved in cell wall biosynthesis
MTPAPLISVLLPTHNGVAFLPHALESLCAQEAGEALDVVAVDDGSTDGTVALLERYASRLPITIIARRARNWVENTNLALERSRGAYVSLLHQDDGWLPGRHGRLASAAAAHPDVPVIISDALFVNDAGRPVGPWRGPWKRKERTLAPADWFAPLLVQNFLAIGAPLVRRDALVEAGGLDASLRYAADWKLWLSLAAKHPARYLPGPMVEFRVHGEAQTLVIARDPGEFERQLNGVLEEALRRVPPGVDRLARWVSLARFSVTINCTASARAVGRAAPLRPLASQAWRLGPAGVLAYLRYSRLIERSVARLRAGVHAERS